EVLAVTRELSRVRGEIERLEGKLRYLASQTEQADIYVHLEEERKISGKKDWRPGAVLRKAVDNLLVNVQKTIDAGIAFAVGFIPLFFLYVLGIFILWRLFRRGYRFWRERLRKER
ncbi:MAG TPA: DUF4349 domain-containing protein, partial [Candidatus Moranbacteria bacterium]|nr:DUF4349 domain-containing protein [Candidatus Moranbacteria bacterium]